MLQLLVPPPPGQSGSQDLLQGDTDAILALSLGSAEQAPNLHERRES